MKSSGFLPIVVAIISLCSGCLTHRYGDARLQKNSDLFSITQDRLYLKPVSLGQTATHKLCVRDLPFPIYPTHLLIPLTSTEAERKEDFPWEPCRLRIEFRAPNSQVFFSEDVSLAQAARGRSPGTFHQLDVQLRQPDRRSWRAPENMPHHTSYDVVVTVIEPSRNTNHRATLYADTYVK